VPERPPRSGPGTDPFRLAWLGPRYWGTWAAVGLLRLGVSLPYAWHLALGRALGRALYATQGRRRRIAERNLALCFPDGAPEARARLLHSSFESLGIAFFEVALAWWGSDRRVAALGQVHGLEHLDQGLERGRGAILLSGHFTTLELGARLLRLHRGFRPMYRPSRNPVWDRIMLRSRERHVERAIDRRDVRGTLRALRANEPVWYAPDQDYGREHSVFVPFFGVPAATITATARLAALSGAPVLPFFQERLPGGRGYRVTLDPPLEGFPSGDEAADAARINRIIEERVRAHPEQYLWTHRRFKTRPPGAPGWY
jgi:KDO2-lipid IV(A) lauroyltransferase